MPLRRRHHYVPAFYLRRFASDAGLLNAYRRTDGRTVHNMPVRAAAVETGLYMVEDESGEDSDAAEIVISEIEQQVAPAFGELCEGPWPPEFEVRGLIANHIALQYVRTRDKLHAIAAMYDHLGSLRLALTTATQVRELLSEIDGDPPSDEEVEATLLALQDHAGFTVELHPNHMMLNMLAIASSFVQGIADRKWHQEVSITPRFLASDTPVVPIPFNPTAPVGLLTAAEIWLPIDPHHNLVLAHPDDPRQEARRPVAPDAATRTAEALAMHAYDWIFEHPASGALGAIGDLPTQPRPAVHISGPDIDALADAYRRIADQDSAE